MRRKPVLAFALTVALTLISGIVGAIAYHCGGTLFGLIMAGLTLIEGCGLAVFVTLVERHIKRQGIAREHRRRQRLAPLPQQWDVPDYLPRNLTLRDF